MQFRAVVIPSGNATAVEIPDDVMQSLGPEARPPVAIIVNGHSWRSRVALMNGHHLVGISAAHRAAAGIAEGQMIDIDISLDTTPREVEEPNDLKAGRRSGRPRCLRQPALRPQGQACSRYRCGKVVGGARPPDRQAGRNLGSRLSARASAARYRPSSARLGWMYWLGFTIEDRREYGAAAVHFIRGG